MLKVKSLDGQVYPAVAQVPRTRVIGEREITLSFLRSEINDKFLKDIETGWTAEFQGDKYWLYNPQEDKHGNKSFDCLLDFIRQGNKVWHIDDVEDKSMTIENSLGPLFNDLPDYTLQIIDNFYANTMNYSNRQTTTERFLYFIDRHDAEFEIPIGSKTVQVRNEVGTYRDDLMIHEDDNLNNLQLNTQDESFCTTVAGYYDFDDDGNPRQSVTYRSSLADKYGEIPGEPILDDRYNNRDAVYEAARKRQESSYQLSFEVTSELFETPVNEGDYVPLVIPSKSINMYIRAVEINELFDEDEDLIEATYSFGNENISQLYRKTQYEALMDVNDILRGKKPIPPSVLPKAFRRAFEVIRGDNDSVIDYRKDRLIGHHDKNAGNAVELNVSGLQFIRNGEPRSAITYEGVVTEALTAGTIDTNRIKIVGSDGFFYISGDEFFAGDSNDSDKYTLIKAGSATFSKNIEIIRYDGVSWTQDGSPRFGSPIITKQNMDIGVEKGNRNYSTENDFFSLFEAGYGSHDGRYANFVLLPSLRPNSRSSSAHIEITIEPSNIPAGVTINSITHRQIIYRDNANDSVVLNLPLPPPTFEAVSFLLKFRLDSQYSGNYAAVRTARCWVSS